MLNLTDTFDEASLSGSRNAIVCVDDCSSFKTMRRFKCNNNATAVLGDINDTHVAPVKLKRRILSDVRAEFAGYFQFLLDKFDIDHKLTPLHILQYDRVVEWALSMLRHKTVTLLRGVTQGKTLRVCAEAFKCACEMSNRPVTTSFK